jgi:putative tryptophan/tyrosine transport system substrate-binding protein
MLDLRRRQFLTLLGGAAAAWPIAARAQSAMPVIGFVRPSTPESVAHLLPAFHAGLKEIGFVEGQNVAIEYRWPELHDDRLREIAAELVRRQVAIIVTPGSTAAAHAAKAATTTIPVVYSSGVDPVESGLISSLNRPGGNVTGIYQVAVDFVAKRLGLLHELVPAVTTIAVLVNPANPRVAELTTKEAQVAARSLGLEIKVFPTRNSRDIDAAFIDIAHQRIGAVLISADVFFTSRRVQFATLATRFAIPAVFPVREYADVGGLMSYGENLAEVWRRVGIYVGRVLKGERGLPVEQSTKFEFVINLQTARALDLAIPSSLLAIADEVIE